MATWRNSVLYLIRESVQFCCTAIAPFSELPFLRFVSMQGVSGKDSDMLAALQQERKWGVERGSAAWSFVGGA